MLMPAKRSPHRRMPRLLLAGAAVTAAWCAACSSESPSTPAVQKSLIVVAQTPPATSHAPIRTVTGALRFSFHDFMSPATADRELGAVYQAEVENLSSHTRSAIVDVHLPPQLKILQFFTPYASDSPGNDGLLCGGRGPHAASCPFDVTTSGARVILVVNRAAADTPAGRYRFSLTVHQPGEHTDPEVATVSATVRLR